MSTVALVRVMFGIFAPAEDPTSASRSLPPLAVLCSVCEHVHITFMATGNQLSTHVDQLSSVDRLISTVPKHDVEVSLVVWMHVRTRIQKGSTTRKVFVSKKSLCFGTGPGHFSE